MKGAAINIMKFIGIFLGTIAVLFAAYIFTFQYLVNKGSEIVDEHCIKVNPYIIARKNAFNYQYQIMMSGKLDGFKAAWDKYFIASSKYINAEKQWLPKDRNFLDGQLFNFMMPEYLKDAANFQYDMYYHDYLSSVYINEANFENDKTKQLELSQKTVDEAKLRDSAESKYNAIWDDNKGKKDWIFWIVKVPPSKCPAENNNIPNTPNIFDPTPTPQPEGANPDSPAS